MNKQELIERMEGLNKLYGENKNYVSYDDVLNLVKQLYEPQPVKVPQFVADWYEKHKDDLEYDIWEYILHWGKQQKSEFYEWMNHANNKPFQTLAKMHQFGYEVEKEPKYTVRVKGICGNHETLNREKHSNKWLFSDREENSLYGTHHTRNQLEDAGFGWVFDCPGFQIEEVTE